MHEGKARGATKRTATGATFRNDGPCERNEYDGCTHAPSGAAARMDPNRIHGSGTTISGKA